ncbi:MAG: pseudouridine-5'-phosphate glycosidase [Gemmatimonadaceae bacterium]|nr:pseudouridine-5'-phosphate glycosidase [Gemmatimonadaceae bacterium]MCW5826644.1 pseudouridine-5'-phosphate glycosidase [Gemmatimonadaceae bacterium]
MRVQGVERLDGAVVALESSVLAQGLPIPANADASRRMLAAVRAAGAVPAITAVVRGQATLGLTPEELARFLRRDGVRKVSARDLGACVADGADGATTVAASLAICRAAGVRVFATGGIGGVHREPAFDESADLLELSRTQAVVVCAGAKSILDLPATLERLESYGVTVLGYGADEFPGFFAASTGLTVPLRADSPAAVARIAQASWSLGHPAAVLVVQPPPAAAALGAEEVAAAVDSALAAARRDGVRGAAVTPFLLQRVQQATGGRSLSANLALLESNAALAGEVAVALAALT